MADNSAIEWTDATFNPIRARNKKTGKVGWHCEHASTGCEFCYAESFNKRLGTSLPFKPGHRAAIDIFLDGDMLMLPLRLKRPRRIFVCSMSDMFADFVPDEWIDQVFAVMALCPQHMFQVLTKRARRMREYFAAPLQHNRMELAAEAIRPSVGKPFSPKHVLPKVLPNVWLGVSTERQQEADERIPLLLQTPAAVRFISAEPLLGPINLFDYIGPWGPTPQSLHAPPELDWIIVGGESGHGARSMHPDWARSLRDQCAAAGVSFFFKQWGEWSPSTPNQAKGNPHSGWQAIKAHPHAARAEELYPEAGAAFVERVSKKAAGRLLDGVEHNGMPKVQA